MDKIGPDQGGKKPPESSGTLIKELVYMIRRIMQAGAIYTKELQKTYQVSFPQLYCLVTLYENGSMPISKIAHQILVKSSTLTGIIDRLETKGFVKRVRNAIDRRIIYIELTERGKDLAEKAPPLIQQRLVDGLKDLPEDEAEKLLHGLRILTKMLEVEDVPVEKVPESYIGDVDF